MGKTGLIFPGQGAQVCGMGKDFYDNFKEARTVYDEASNLLGFSVPELCFVQNDRLDITEYTQAAMVTTGIAMMNVLCKETGIRPDMAAGLSLGEYEALVATGAMSAKDAITIVRKRGILMQQAVPAGEGAMAAVLMLSGEVIENVLSGMEDVQIANYNCPGQIVISGKTRSVEEACVRLKEAGAKRTIMLNVSGPFHSALLKDAGEKLLSCLQEVEITQPQFPYVTNVDASVVTESSGIKQLLSKQVYSSVRWWQCMETMISEGVDRFIEIGPGRTLAGFMKKINSDVKVITINTVKDLEEQL